VSLQAGGDGATVLLMRCIAQATVMWRDYLQWLNCIRAMVEFSLDLEDEFLRLLPLVRAAEELEQAADTDPDLDVCPPDDELPPPQSSSQQLGDLPW
jgi:hypothetical protein